MPQVEVRDGDVEGALKVFSRLVNQDGTLKRLRERRYYSSPSEKKRTKHRKAVKRLRQAESKKRKWLAENRHRRNRYSPGQRSGASRVIASLERKKARPTQGTALIILLAQTEIKECMTPVIFTLKDQGKYQRGFPTGGIEMDETLIEGAIREVREETGLHLKLADNVKPFHVKDVSRDRENPYFMKGILATEFSGTVVEGEEIEAKSGRWETIEDLNFQMMGNNILINHAHFLNFLQDMISEKGLPEIKRTVVFDQEGGCQIV